MSAPTLHPASDLLSASRGHQASNMVTIILSDAATGVKPTTLDPEHIHFTGTGTVRRRYVEQSVIGRAARLGQPQMTFILSQF